MIKFFNWGLGIGLKSQENKLFEMQPKYKNIDNNFQ